MSLLKRISDLVRSNVNDVLDKAEDPRKILDQTILDMQREHKKAKKMLLETMTLLKTAEKQVEKYNKDSTEWEQKAMAALKGGNEELARSALGEKQKAEDLATEAESGVVGQRKYVEELKIQLNALEQKIEEAKKKRDELIARMQAAEMKKKQAEGRSPDGRRDYVNESSAFDTFNRMVEKIENSEAEVEARSELMGNHDPVAEAELEKTLKQQSADEALAALKAKMGGGASTPPAAKAETPAADDPKASAIEDELAALRAKLDGGG
jgi:phage shock protein A